MGCLHARPLSLHQQNKPQHLMPYIRLYGLANVVKLTFEPSVQNRSPWHTSEPRMFIISRNLRKADTPGEVSQPAPA